MRRIRNNLGLKILAIVLAFITSIIVKMTVSPEGELPTQSVFTKEISVIAPQSSELIPILAQKEVMVTLRGQRNSLERVAANTIGVDVDLSLRDKPGNALEPVNVHAPSGLEVSAVEPSRVWVQVAKRDKDVAPVKVRYLGEVGKNHMAGKPLVAPEKVIIEGPSDDIDRVRSVEALVPLSGAKRNFSTHVSSLKPLDATGSVVSSVSVGSSGVDVTVPIFTLQTVAVSLDKITLPRSKKWNYTVTCMPTEVVLEQDANEAQTLRQLTSISTQACTFTHAPGLQEKHLRLNLPKGCKVLDNDSATVTVSVLASPVKQNRSTAKGDKAD